LFETSHHYREYTRYDLLSQYENSNLLAKGLFNKVSNFLAKSRKSFVVDYIIKKESRVITYIAIDSNYVKCLQIFVLN